MSFKFLAVGVVSAVVLVGQSAATVASTPPSSTAAVAPAGSVDWAVEEAQRTGTPVTVDSQTTPTTLVKATPEGTFRAEVTPGPVRVGDGNGGWRNVDLTLIKQADGSVAPRQTVTPIRLSGGGVSDLVQITDDGATLGLGWPQSLPSPQLSGSSATYPEVYPGIDLVVRVGTEGFGTFVVVKNRTAAADARIRKIQYLVRGSGLNTTSTGDTLTLTDGTGRVRFDAGHAYMWDSRGSMRALTAPTEAATRRAADDRLSTAHMALSRDVLSVTPDAQLLDDPQTVYPVVIDPAIKAYREQTYWTSVASNGLEWVNSATEMARVGRSWDSPSFIARSFYRFDTSTFAGKAIKSATFSHKLVHSPNNDCSLATYGPGVRVYSSEPIYSTTVWPGPASKAYSPTINAKAHGYSTYCSGYDRLDWDVKAIVDAASSTLTLGMRSNDESDPDGWRKFDNDATLNYPLLTVDYNSLPNQPGAPTMDAGVSSAPKVWWTQTPTPTLRAPVSDPDGTAGGQIWGSFELWKNGMTKVATGTGSSVNSPGTSVWTVPAGILEPGFGYTVRVWGKDYADTSALWSDYIVIWYDAVNPNAPTVPPMDNIYAGATATFSASSTSNDVTSFCYGVKTDTTPTCVATPDPAIPLAITTAPVTTAGPAWVTVKAKDVAGRVSSSVKVWFDVIAANANHRWRLDGSGADSIGTTALTPTSGTPYVAGHSGEPTDQAISFNGTSQSATGAKPLTTSGSFSVAAWVRYTGTGTSPNATAVSQIGTQDTAFALGLRSGLPAFVVKSVDGTTGTHMAQGTLSLPLNTWVHLVGVYSSISNSIDLYVDGDLASQASVTGTVFDAAGSLAVGRGQTAGAPSMLWTGQVDEVLTFPGVLDQNGVRQWKDLAQ